jgi:ABC-type branched-subunit amino acid transport system ATPase component
MSNEVLIKVEGVSKKFCKDLKKSLKYGFQDLGGALFASKQERELRPDEFWAVKDISFEVKRGECLGLIGHNGAGKSTIFGLITGALKPKDGKVFITNEATIGKAAWHSLTRDGERQPDEAILKGLIERHFKHTGSTIARTLLDDWVNARTKFVKVFPTEYKRALGEMFAAASKAKEKVTA